MFSITCPDFDLKLNQCREKEQFLLVNDALANFQSLSVQTLFTLRQGAPANRATRVGGLKHSPPLHATHLSEIVGRTAAKHNKQHGGQKKRQRPLFSV